MQTIGTIIVAVAILIPGASYAWHPHYHRARDHTTTMLRYYHYHRGAITAEALEGAAVGTVPDWNWPPPAVIYISPLPVYYVPAPIHCPPSPRRIRSVR